MKPRWLPLVAAGFGTLALAADWPQYRGPTRDNKIPNFTPPASWPKELKQQWKVPVGDGVSSPALVGDRLYVFTREGDEEVVRCVDAKTGKVLWTDETRRGECGAVLDAGPVLLALTSDTQLVAFKPSNAGYEEVAKYKVADAPTWAYPIVDGKRVFVKDRDSLALWTFE